MIAVFMKKKGSSIKAPNIMSEESVLRKDLADVYLRLSNFSRLRNDVQWKEYDRRWIELTEMTSELTLVEHHLLAQKSFQLENWSICRRHCEWIIEFPKADAEEKAFAFYHLSEINARENDPRWKDYLRQWIKFQTTRQDRSFQETYLLTFKMRQLGQINESEQYLLQIADSEEGTPEQRAVIHFYLGEFAKSRSETNWQELVLHGIEVLICKPPDSFLNCYQLGVKYFEIGNLPEAHSWLEKAQQYPAPSPQQQADTCFLLGDICKRQKNEERCRHYFGLGIEALTRKPPDGFLDCYQLGVKCFEIGNLQEAHSWLEKTQQYPPPSPQQQADACFLLGDIYKRDGNEERCHHFFGRGIEALTRKPPDGFLDCHQLGIKYFEIGNLPEAHSWLEKAQQYPAPSPQQQADTCFLLGDICKRQKNEERCHHFFGRGIEALTRKPPDGFLDCYQLGIKYFEIGNLPAARIWLEKAQEHPSSSLKQQADTCFLLGDIYKRDGNEKRCHHFFGLGIEALTRKPPDGFLDCYQLGIKYFEIGNLSAARIWLEKALKHPAPSPQQQADTCFLLGDICKRDGNKERCYHFFSRGIKALTRKPPDGFLDCYQLGIKYFEIGNLPAARIWLEKALKHPTPSPQQQADACFLLGDVSKREKNEEMCRHYFRKGVEFLAQKPSKSSLDLYRLGEKSFQAGDTINSRRYFEEFVQCRDASPDLLANASSVLKNLGGTPAGPESASSEVALSRQGTAPIGDRLMVNAKKRVLYIAHGHPDFSPGGGELAADFLYQQMKKSEEYEPFLMARIADTAGGIQHLGCRLLRHPKDDRTHLMVSSNAAYDYFYQTKIIGQLNETDIYEALREFLLTLKPDIVHFQHYIHLGLDWLSLVRSILPQARILLTLHEYTAICAHHGAMIKTQRNQLCYGANTISCHECFPKRPPWHFFLRDQLYRSNFAAVDHFISPSHFLKQRHIEWGMDPETISVIENGRPRWQKTEPTRPKPGRPFKVAFFGQIVFHKGLDVYLKAAFHYLTQRKQAKSEQGKQFPDLTFLVYGVKHGLPSELGKQCDELMQSCQEVLHVHGAYDMHSMQTLLENVDCVVIPSIWWENSPLVVQEAFMAGIPIICSNAGGLAEKVTDRVNGLHFLLGDHFDLLARIIELADSPELYAKLTQGIPEVYSSEEMAAPIHQLYHDLLLRPSQPCGKEIQCI
jgi:glycosyltransferase involved in cell wall biosynthesis/Tfp pilus assembly protein PilF/TolA-binding protein